MKNFTLEEFKAITEGQINEMSLKELIFYAKEHSRLLKKHGKYEGFENSVRLFKLVFDRANIWLSAKFQKSLTDGIMSPYLNEIFDKCHYERAKEKIKEMDLNQLNELIDKWKKGKEQNLIEESDKYNKLYKLILSTVKKRKLES